MEFHGNEKACELAWAKKVDFTFSTGKAEAVMGVRESLGLFSLIVSLGVQCLSVHAIYPSFPNCRLPYWPPLNLIGTVLCPTETSLARY